MKAIVSEGYGPDALELREVDQPPLRDDGLLIRVRAVSVNRSDWEGLVGRPAYARIGNGLFRGKERILGSDIAGRVEAVGKDVTKFQPGDQVFGDILYFGSGGFAEYVSVPERATLVQKPTGITFEQAAAIPQSGVLALQGLETKGGLQDGQRLLINGSGGGSGMFAIQMAKRIGADVTGVDNSLKLDAMRKHGADHVIDYNSEDFTRKGQKYDRILDFAGYRSILAHRRALTADGVYLFVGGSVPRLLQAVTVGPLISMSGDKSMGLLMARPNTDDLEYLSSEVELGRLTPVIERTYELAEVPDALRHLGENRAKGKLVITLG